MAGRRGEPKLLLKRAFALAVVMVLVACAGVPSPDRYEPGSPLPPLASDAGSVPPSALRALAVSLGVRRQEIRLAFVRPAGSTRFVVFDAGNERWGVAALADQGSDWSLEDIELTPFSSTPARGSREYGLGVVYAGASGVAIGGFVDPEMSSLVTLRAGHLIDRVAVSTGGSVLGLATAGSQARVLREGCVAMASPIPPESSPLQPSRASDPDAVRAAGREFVSRVLAGDASAAELTLFEEDATALVQDLADLLRDGQAGWEAAEEGSDGFAYWLIPGDGQRRLNVYLAESGAEIVVVSYSYLDRCE